MRLVDAVGKEWLIQHVNEALQEDLGDNGDITSLATIPPDKEGYAELIAKSNGVLAGIDWGIFTGKLCTPAVDWKFIFQDGSVVKKGDVLARVNGPIHGILISERTALNGLGRLSGIATMAAEATKRVAGTNAVVLDTRKTTPGWRKAEKYAVLQGGGSNHRIGLFDEILIKENHVEASGGLLNAIRDAQKWRIDADMDEYIPIEIEVTSIDELKEALEGKPDRILLDNFSIEMMEEAVVIAEFQCDLEASGGITLENIHEVAQTGVDRISLGALTHSVIPLDLSLLIR